MTPAVLEPGLLSASTPVIIGHEGERMHLYPDSRGIPTIGVGLALMQEGPSGKLIKSPYAQSVCARCGVNYDDLLAARANLTPEQSRHILSICQIDVIEWLVKLFPSFWSYPQPRQICLLDMGFELGETKFRGFRKMISCILAGDWTGAADQALHSQWASEVAGRAEHDAGLMRAG